MIIIMKALRLIAVILAFFLLSTLLVGCGSKKQNESFFAMGTYITQTVYDNDNYLLESVKLDINKIDANISYRIDNSYISLLNKDNTAAFDTQTYNMLYDAVEFCDVFNGVFDVSALSLTSLWDFDSESPSAPNENDIKLALDTVGFKNIYFGDNNTVSVKKGTQIDLGGLGKGYACDIAVKKYKEAKVNGIIVVGGSIGVNGTKPDGEYFLVGVRNPFSENSIDAFAELVLKSGFVSTSGSYEKFFKQDNILYHHILDMKTGYPVQNELISVSVVCDNGMLSDMLSTACFALGIEKSLPILEKYNAQAIFVKSDKKVVITEDLKPYITIYSNYEVRYI